MATKTVISEMLSLIEKAGSTDLAEIDEIIAKREAELDAYVATKRSEIDALHQLRKVCDVKLNGKKPRGRRKGWKSAEATDEDSAPTGRVSTLGDWIVARLEERGPQTLQQLAAAKGASEHSIKMAIGKAKGRILWDDETDRFRLND